MQAPIPLRDDSKHALPVAPNVVDHRFHVDETRPRLGVATSRTVATDEERLYQPCYFG